ncbi:MAG: FAD-dependent oxidoreductase, partial [Armatimonadota bacterium]
RPATEGRNTVLVVGAGLTGIETAAEMPTRLRKIFGKERFRVLLADHKSRIGADMGEDACPVIAEALGSLGVETRPGSGIASIDGSGAELQSGERIAAETVIWCAGLEASPLTGLIPAERDWLGRLPIDRFLRVNGVPHLFAAGDSARLPLSGGHDSVMSCQHSRPMGRFAGHNAVRDLLGLPLLGLQIDWYVTVLDLGEWGALYTEGWERRVAATGGAAKKTKMTINRERIYPPLTGNPSEILAAAAPVVQTAPQRDLSTPRRLS